LRIAIACAGGVMVLLGGVLVVGVVFGQGFNDLQGKQAILAASAEIILPLALAVITFRWLYGHSHRP
jgi:hypothetical protein